MKRLLTSILVIVMLATTAMATPASEHAQWRADDSPAQGHYVQGLSQRKIDALTETTIIKDSKSPTGYYVTFRYYAPDATRVRIRGEWSFATDRGSFYPMSDNIMPEDYEDGMGGLRNVKSFHVVVDTESNNDRTSTSKEESVFSV